MVSTTDIVICINIYILQYYCCGLFNAHDYDYKHLTVPESCYAYNIDANNDDETEGNASSIHGINNVGCLETVWRSYKFAVHRHVLFNWALFITEVNNNSKK